MSWDELIATFLLTVNEILSAGIVIIAASLLLYNLTRNMTNRVARSSGAVLASVTFAYLVDVFLSLDPTIETALTATRLQWLGLAFIPAALFHLSDALLATTGLPSRGRRRAVVRILYGISILFLAGTTLTDWVAVPIANDTGIKMNAAPLFIVYVAYFITALIVTFINVQRARTRCLTISSKRRMTYLQATILTPAIGIFPYSVLLPVNFGDLSLGVQILINLANIVVITMLIFLSYPLSFFGSDKPDRVVKVELLRFLLQGPGTGILALAVITGTRRATEIMTLPAEAFMPFAVVAVVMFWQWMISLSLPYLERWLVYGDEDDEQLAKLQGLSERIITRSDLQQLIEASLEALCDYLRTEVAFVSAFKKPQIELIRFIGQERVPEIEAQIQEDSTAILDLVSQSERVTGRSTFQAWQDYYLVPLYSKRVNGTSEEKIIGLMGVQSPKNPLEILDLRDADVLYAFVQRAEQSLDDLLLQDEIFAALEGLLPQLHLNRKRAEELEYQQGRAKPQVHPHLPNREEFYEQVREALRQYWGGPGLSRSNLLNLRVVQRELQTADSPIHAVRTIIQAALERLKPEGVRTMTGTEWVLYNIIDLRFIEGKKVRDVARRMSMSEPDLYRKQRMAIEALADAVLEMEKEILNS